MTYKNTFCCNLLWRLPPHPTTKKNSSQNPKFFWIEATFKEVPFLLSTISTLFWTTFEIHLPHFFFPLMLLRCSHILGSFNQQAFKYYGRKEGDQSTAQVEHFKSDKVRCGVKGLYLKSQFHSITGVPTAHSLIHISSWIAGRTKSGTLNWLFYTQERRNEGSLTCTWWIGHQKRLHIPNYDKLLLSWIILSLPWTTLRTRRDSCFNISCTNAISKSEWTKLRTRRYTCFNVSCTNTISKPEWTKLTDN